MKTLSDYKRWTRGWFVMLLATLTLGVWAMPCKQQPVMAALTLSLLAFFLYLNNRPILTVITVLVLLTQWNLFDTRGTCKPYIAASWLAGLNASSGSNVGKASHRFTASPSSNLLDRSWSYAKTQAEWMSSTLQEEGSETLNAVVAEIRPVADAYQQGDFNGAVEQENCGRKKCRY